MEIAGLGRLLLVLGLVLALAGIVLLLGSKVPLLGRLPGDLVMRREGFTLFVPVITMIVISLALTILINLIRRILR